jgi:signal transduction histidine kinase
VLRDQVDELRTALPQAEIQLDLTLPVQADCDASRVAQVVSNLVRNAVQHGEPNAPVSVRLSESAGAAVLTIHNQGSPIPAEDLPDLFDPFKRGRRAGGVGSGLGLFIVREIVTALDGEVHVRSDDAGTTFTVSLPNHPAAEHTAQAHPA